MRNQPQPPAPGSVSLATTRPVRRLLAGVTLTACACASGSFAQTARPLGVPAQVNNIGAAMDRLARLAEEWGTMHMSAPLLVDATNNSGFDLRRGATNYFIEAKSEVQAASAFSEQTFQSLNIALQAQNDPTVTAAFGESLRRYQLQARSADDTQAMLQQLSHLQFTEGVAAALAETNPATRQALLNVLRSNLTASPTVNPTFPSASGSNNVPDLASILKPNTNYQGVFTNPQFTAFLGLLAAAKAPNPTLNNRVALNIAAGDQTTEAIFRLIANPKLAQDFAGRRVLLGVVTVSIDPGYRTRKDYAADLGILVRLEYRDARKEVVERFVQDKKHVPSMVRAAVVADYGWTDEATLKNLQSTDLQQAIKSYTSMDQGKRLETYRTFPQELVNTNVWIPVAYALSPLADVEVTDEASSQRSQSEFALSLAAILRQAGFQAQASAMEQYVKRREMDAHTRSALVGINTYSAGGGIFGWQIAPRFRAMEDPALSKRGANILDRQTFPSAIMIGLNPDELLPHLGADDKGRLTVLEPYIAFTSIPRWLPLNKPGWWRWWRKRYSETDRLRASAGLVDAKNDLPVLASVANGAFAGTANLAKFRLRALQFDTFGSDNGQNLDPAFVVPLPEGPKPKPLEAPSVSAIVPSAVQLDADAKGGAQARAVHFAVLGMNLKQIDVANILPLIGQLGPTTASFADGAILINTTINDKEPVAFKLPWQFSNPDGTAVRLSVATPKVTVTVRKQAEESKPGTPVVVMKTAQIRAPAPGSATEYTVSISPGASDDQVRTARSIIEAEINKNKPEAGGTNISVQIQVEQKK